MVIGKKEGNRIRKQFKLEHNGKSYDIVEQDSVKICGITYSNDIDIAYKENIINRIVKLERQLNIWRQRNLTIEGKILITKTFGLSQIIYALQSTFIKTTELKQIDDIIYRFIWNLKKDSYRVSGKIKRQIMVGSVSDGGLNAPRYLRY